MQPNVAGTPATVRFVSPDASWAIDAITPPQHPFPWRHCGRSYPFANPRPFGRGFFRFRETSTPLPYCGFRIGDCGFCRAVRNQDSGIGERGCGLQATDYRWLGGSSCQGIGLRERKPEATRLSSPKSPMTKEIRSPFAGVGRFGRNGRHRRQARNEGSSFVLRDFFRHSCFVLRP